MAKKDITQTISNQEQRGKRKLRTKDLIYTGAFAAVYLVLMLVIVMATNMFPILYLIAPIFVGAVCGTVYELCVLKVRKFGAALILGILFALLACMNAIPGFILAVAAALAAELVIKAGKYESKKMYLASFVVFNINMSAPYLMLVYAHDRFIDLAAGYRGAETAAQLNAITPDWIWFAILAFAIIGGILGALIAGKLIDKHFRAAGVV